MLQSRLENEIYARMSQTGRECSVIVMHPQTWINLTKEVYQSDSTAINRNNLLLHYRGIKVLRSLDIKENLFEVQ
jgi:hypothetical protein